MNIGVVIIEGHVQGLANTRLLGKAGIPVIVIDKTDCVARYSKYCMKYFKCPDFIGDDFAEYLIRLHRAEGLQDWVLLPSNDHAVHTISRNKNCLSSLYKVITEDIETIEKIYNKRKLLSIAEAIGVPIPATIMPEDANPEEVSLRYPLIIKGNQGLSFYKRYKHKALLVNNPNDLKEIWDSILIGINPNEYFIQEVIPYIHKTVSVTVFAVNGEVHVWWMGVKIREHPITFGTATCCKSVFEEDLLEYSKKIITELNYTGVCEIEWLRDCRDGLPKLIEINARTWLWVGLAAKCGVNYPQMIYEFLHHGSVPKAREYILGLHWINVYTDLVYSCKRVIAGVDRPLAIVKPYRRFTEASWERDDVLPFVVYGFSLIKYFKNR